MPLETYFDLRLRRDPDIPAWERLARLWHLVHSAASRSAVPFAVSFPFWMQGGFGFGETLRLFTPDSSRAESLYDALEKAPQAADLADGSRIRKAHAPQTFEAFLMHRIPSGPSKPRKNVELERAKELRDQALRRRIAQQQHLPFVRMRSSSGHAFRLVVERVAASGTETGAPNGYGLSRTSQIVALPIIPASL